MDLTGRRFGRLLVLERVARKGPVTWRCRCDCGRVVDVLARSLLHAGTSSCGCYRRELSAANLSGDIAEKLGQTEGTNASRLRSVRPSVNNKSGYRGVSWHRYGHGGGAWIAVIYFQRKRYRLGFYRTPEEASEAYLRAKAHIHGDFLAWYDQQK